MTSVDAISEALRGGLSVAPQALVSPFALACALRLRLRPTCCGRPGLYGSSIVYNEAQPAAAQAYQVARAACAFALRAMGAIEEVSPHDLAVALCGVVAPKFTRTSAPRFARVVILSERRLTQAV